MKHYPFDIYDYRSETEHLDRLGHYIYRKLLDIYYEKELPITTEKHRLAIGLGLTTDEIPQLEAILVYFFELRDDGWHNERCDREIAIYRDMLTAKQRAGLASGKARRANSDKRTGVQQVFNSSSTGVEQVLNKSEQKEKEKKNNKNTTARARARANGKFKKPTPEEIQAYLDEVGEYRFTGQEFYDSNESKGWVVGRNRTPMVKWKSAVGTWRTTRDKAGEENFKKLKPWENGI